MENYNEFYERRWKQEQDQLGYIQMYLEAGYNDDEARRLGIECWEREKTVKVSEE